MSFGNVYEMPAIANKQTVSAPTDVINKSTGVASSIDKGDYAMLSKAVYGKGDGKKVDGWSIDGSLSDDDVTTYVDDATGKVVQAYRGTDLKHAKRGIKDFLADAAEELSLTKHNSRFTHARRQAQRAIDKYGKDNVSVTGHSLGGAIANDVSSKLGISAYSFSPLVGGNRPTDIKMHRVDYSKVHQFANPNDPASLLSGLERKAAFAEIHGAPKSKTVWEEIGIGSVGTAASVAILAGAPAAAADAFGMVMEGSGEAVAGGVIEDGMGGFRYPRGYNRIPTDEVGSSQSAARNLMRPIAEQGMKRIPYAKKITEAISGGYVYQKANELMSRIKASHGMEQYMPTKEEYSNLIKMRRAVNANGDLLVPSTFTGVRLPPQDYGEFATSSRVPVWA